MIQKIRDETLYAEFLIDRAALGVDIDQLVELCKDQLDLELPTGQVSTFLEKNQSKIDGRKVEIKQQIAESSPSVLLRLDKISREMDTILTETAKGDRETFAKLVTPYLRNLEIIAKLLGDIKEDKIIIRQADLSQQSIAALQFFEEEGLIHIKDKKALSEMIT